MEQTRGITVKVDTELHSKAKSEQESRGQTMSQYITMVLSEHFNGKGGINMTGARTMAFQVDEDLFQRIRVHLSRTGLTQKAYVLGLIETSLNEAEAVFATQREEEFPEVQPELQM